MKYQRWSKESVAQLKCLYDQGLTLVEMSSKMSRKTTAIKSALAKFGIRRKVSYRNLVLNSLSENDKAYLAGIIDGEGSIQINKRSTSLVSGEKNPLFCACLKIFNNDPRLLSHICEITGCGIVTKGKRKGKRRPTFRWYATKSIALQLLNEVYQYLIIKKEQADVVFLLQGTYNQIYSRKGTPPEIVHCRDDCYQKLKELHHKEFENENQMYFRVDGGCISDGT